MSEKNYLEPRKAFPPIVFFYFLWMYLYLNLTNVVPRLLSVSKNNDGMSWSVYVLPQFIPPFKVPQPLPKAPYQTLQPSPPNPRKLAIFRGGSLSWSGSVTESVSQSGTF